CSPPRGSRDKQHFERLARLEHLELKLDVDLRHHHAPARQPGEKPVRGQAHQSFANRRAADIQVTYERGLGDARAGAKFHRDDHILDQAICEIDLAAGWDVIGRDRIHHHWNAFRLWGDSSSMSRAAQSPGPTASQMRCAALARLSRTEASSIFSR